MKIQCPHCKKTYVIQEELLKSYKGEIVLPCPQCKGKIQIDIKGQSALEEGGTPSSPEKVQEVKPKKEDPDGPKPKKKTARKAAPRKAAATKAAPKSAKDDDSGKRTTVPQLPRRG